MRDTDATPQPAEQPEPARAPAVHPALQVKLAELPPPRAPALPAVTRYDAFGRPILDQPVTPKPPPVRKPRARIVRYDAMGLPILD